MSFLNPLEHRSKSLGMTLAFTTVTLIGFAVMGAIAAGIESYDVFGEQSVANATELREFSKIFTLAGIAAVSATGGWWLLTRLFFSDHYDKTPYSTFYIFK